MVHHHSSPEAGALRIASAPAHATEARNTLQGHATDLRIAHGSGHYAPSSTDVATGSSLTIPPIGDSSGSNKPYNMYANAEVAPTARQPLDSAKPIGEMVRTGSITDNTAGRQPAERERAQDGKAPTVKVQFSDITAESKVPPDFTVKKDGSIVMNNNPEQSGQKSIVIEVEREDGQLMPSDAQQQSVNDLYKYLDARIKTENADAAQNGVKIDDPQNLVSDDTEKAAKARSQRQTPGDMPQEAEEQTQRMSRFKGGGSGQMSRQQANDYFPERTVPRARGENDQIAAMKDVVAGFTSRGSERPYEHVVHRGSRGYGVGRYGLTYDMISSWLNGLDIDGLEELERQGKVPKGTAAKMKAMKASVAKNKETGKDSDLDPFLQKLKAGDKNNPVTAQDINQNFGKEVQELATDFNVGRFAKEMGQDSKNVSPGQLALAMMLGRVPTQEDLGTPENKRFVDAADQAYQIATNRYENPNGPVDFADTTKMTQAMKDAVGQQLWRGYDSATQYGNLGCAITVSRILRAGGLDIGNELSVDGVAAKMRQIARPVSLEEARQSGQAYVIIKKSGGSHTGIGIGDTVVENSSGQRRTVARSLSQSSLRSGSYAFIIPTRDKSNG